MILLGESGQEPQIRGENKWKNTIVRDKVM